MNSGDSRQAIYPDLLPGSYLFEVRAQHQGGVHGPTAQLAFVVQPAWHENLAVRWGSGGLFGLLATALLLVRSRVRERRARALRVSEARYRQLFTQSANAFLLYGPEGRCVDVNREACRLFGGDEATLRVVSPETLGLPTTDQPPDGTPILCTRLDGSTFPARVDRVL